MKLQYNKKYGFISEYRCELTIVLDKLAQLDVRESYEFYYHYVLVDDYGIKEKCLPIRVPGGTVGGIWFDDDRIVTKIFIDTDYVVKNYPINVNDLIQKYVGEKIEW